MARFTMSGHDAQNAPLSLSLDVPRAVTTPRPTQVPPEFYDGQDATDRLVAWLNARAQGEVVAFDPTRDLLCQTEVKVTGRPDLTFQDVGLVRTAPEKLRWNPTASVWERPPSYVGAHLWLLDCQRAKITGRYRVRSTNLVSDLSSDPANRLYQFGSWDAEKELAAALRIENSSGGRIDATLDVDGVWGDGIQWNGTNTDWRVDLRGKVDRNGRQGITPLFVGGYITGFTLLHGRRGGMDFEPYKATRMCGDLEVSGYDLNTQLLPFPAQGKGPVDNVRIHDGISRGLSVPVLKIAASDGARRTGWTLENHVSEWTLGSPSQAAVVADNVTDLTVKGCRMPVATGSSRAKKSVAMTNAGGRTLVQACDFSPGGTFLVDKTPLPGHTLDIVNVTPAQQVVAA